MSQLVFRIRIKNSLNTDGTVFDIIVRSFRILRSTSAFAHAIYDYPLIVLVQHLSKEADNVITSAINTLTSTPTVISTTIQSTLSPKEEKDLPDPCLRLTCWKQAPKPESHASCKAKAGTNHETAIASTPFVAAPWTQRDHQCYQTTPNVHKAGEEKEKDRSALCNYPRISTIQSRPLPRRQTI